MTVTFRWKLSCAVLILGLVVPMFAYSDDNLEVVRPLQEFQASKLLNNQWTQARNAAIERAINPEDYECGPTDFDYWIGHVIGQLDNPANLDVLFYFSVLDWPFWYTLLFDHEAGDEYFGADGRQTSEMKQRFRSLQRFWDIESEDILLQAMHGRVIADDEKMIPFVQFLFGTDAVTAQFIVDWVQSILETDSGMGYDFPLLSLNAFAFSGETEPAGSIFHTLPDKIIMGDGIMEMLGDLGLGGSAPDMVLAHEFGHHVQYELNLTAEMSSPEDTRDIELMADAFAAYFSAHSRGATLQAKRIVDVFRGSYLVGDCSFSAYGHHGTPNQREAAARWAVALAASAANQGHILPSADFVTLFDAQLPILIAPDAD